MGLDIQRIDKVPTLAPRRRSAHKGDMGRVLIVGGSQTMLGAPALAALAALRGGAGLVTMAVPRTIQPHVATLCPCATSLRLACDADGVLAAEAAAQVRKAAEVADVLAVGPGMGVGTPERMVVQAALEQSRPVVLDADGLNNLVALGDWPGRRRCPLVLTPHPGEMARLVSRSIADVQADREQIAAGAVREWGDRRTIEDVPLVLVLKGAGTVVTDGRRLQVNTTGNPGMATGGSGDVLTGLIAALIGQGLSGFDAAALGVHLHGDAGDAAAAAGSEVSLIASDLIDHLGGAFGRLEGT